MKEIFLAKSDGQTVEEHTDRLLVLLKDFENLYGGRFDGKIFKLTEIACRYHDLGKINSAFQNKIYKAMKKPVPEEFCDLRSYRTHINGEIPHGKLSAAFIDENYLLNEGFSENDIVALITAISNHHSGAINYNEQVYLIQKIIQPDLLKNAKLYGYSELFSESLLLNQFTPYKKLDFKNKNIWYNEYVLIKGLLNKMDYGASGGIETTEIAPENAADLTEAAMKNMGFNSLRECQVFAENHQHENIIMTASTGMGKTEAAMLWAGTDKTFYTLPVKISLNAIYKRIGESGYYPKNKLALLHGDALDVLIGEEKTEEIEDAFSAYENARNLCCPFTVCTVDQLFTFVYRAVGTEILEATLSYSKVVIDEIQSYSPELIAKLLYGLETVSKLGGKFMIMTATLPPFVREFFEKEKIQVNVSQPFFLSIARHRFKFIGAEFDFNEIAEKGKTNKVLVICNLVQRAKDVYKKIKEINENVKLLHSKFILNDKTEKETEILRFANSNNKGIWVTTQMVEASLDIDFDCLYTDMSSADSLLQRMGRCYRKRELTTDEPNIFVACSDKGIGNGKKAVYDKTIYDRSIEFLKEFEGKIFSEFDKQKYIDKVYKTSEIKEYIERVYKEINILKNIMPAVVSKSQAQKNLRDIKSVQVIPVAFKDEVAELYNKYISSADKKEKYKILTLIKGFSFPVGQYSKVIKCECQFLKNYCFIADGYDSELGLLTSDEEDNFI